MKTTICLVILCYFACEKAAVYNIPAYMRERDRFVYPDAGQDAGADASL